MKPVSPRKLIQFHNLVAGEKWRGVNVTVANTIVTLTDPVGGVHSADLRDDPEISAPTFMSHFMHDAFQNYVIRQLAPGGCQRENRHYLTWDEGAYGFKVCTTRADNGDFHVRVMAGSGDASNVWPLECSSYNEKYAAWPEPAELSLLKPRAIAEFERLKRFELLLTEEKIAFRPSAYGAEISPLSIRFENGKPTLRFIDFFSPLLEESLQVHLLVKRFMDLDASPAVSDESAMPIDPMEISIDLV